jgi:calmodulin
MFVYTLTDPTESLPEELHIHAGPDGFVIADPATDEEYGSYAWAKVASWAGLKQSDDPTDMELFNVKLGGADYTFECDVSSIIVDACDAASAAARAPSPAKGAAARAGPTELNMAELKEAFEVIDMDADGSVTLAELEIVLGVILLQEQVEALLARLDRDSDALITLEEFVGAATEVESEAGGEFQRLDTASGLMVSDIIRVRRAFEAADMDSNGFIDACELRHVVDQLGEEGEDVDDDTLARVFAHMDVDESGALDFREFLLALGDGSLQQLGVALAGLDASDQAMAHGFGDPITCPPNDLVVAYTFEDPSGALCEELLLLPSPAGLLVCEAAAGGGQAGAAGRTFHRWKWASIEAMSSEKQSDDPTDMELLSVTLRPRAAAAAGAGEGGAAGPFIFELDDAQAMVALLNKLRAANAAALEEHAAKMRARLTPGDVLAQKKKMLQEHGRKGKPAKDGAGGGGGGGGGGKRGNASRNMHSDDPKEFFTQLQQAKLKAIFEVCDTDGGGTISMPELDLLLQVLGLDDDAATIKARLDSDGDGDVTLGEFLQQALVWEREQYKAMIDKGVQKPPRSFTAGARCDVVKIREAFEQCDEDASGEISGDELRVVMNNMGEAEVGDDGLAAIMGVLDPDGSGFVTWVEFLEAIVSGELDKLGICSAFTLADIDGLKEKCSELEGELTAEQDRMKLLSAQNDLLKKKLEELAAEAEAAGVDFEPMSDLEEREDAAADAAELEEEEEEEEEELAKKKKKKKKKPKKGEAAAASSAGGGVEKKKARKPRRVEVESEEDAAPDDVAAEAPPKEDQEAGMTEEKDEEQEPLSPGKRGKRRAKADGADDGAGDVGAAADGATSPVEGGAAKTRRRKSKAPGAGALIVETAGGSDGSPAESGKLRRKKSEANMGEPKSPMVVAVTLPPPAAPLAAVAAVAAAPMLTLPSDAEKQAVMDKAKKAPDALIGWRVEVTLTETSGSGKGEKKKGVVKSTKKVRRGKPTMHVVQFDDGDEKELILDRKKDGKKDKCPFTLIMHVRSTRHIPAAAPLAFQH